MTYSMKKILTFCFFLLFTGLSYSLDHKFYVSLTEITFNDENNRLEISSKVFYDDLQNAILVEDGYKIDDPLTEHKQQIEQYLSRHFSVKVNGVNIPLKMIGVETEIDAVWCYLESEPLANSIEELEVFNNVFVDLFPTQSNIINFFPDKGNPQKVKGLRLTIRQERGTIKLEN